jgi:hypothetical protein
MANFVQENLENLTPRHYLLLANKGKHWFNAYPGKIADYRARYGDDFCMVLWRSGRRDDAYVIPFVHLKSLFVDANLVGGPKKTLRWHGEVNNGELRLLGGRGEPVGVNGLHNSFHLLAITSEPPASATSAPASPELAAITFGLERDLQRALRSNIGQLETGLEIIDGGSERPTDAGRIDITARDAHGRTVIVELKAGTAMPDALTQVLDYVATVSTEDGKRARGILLAGEFHPRVVRAASVVNEVLLLKYRFSFAFERVERGK